MVSRRESRRGPDDRSAFPRESEKKFGGPGAKMADQLRVLSRVDAFYSLRAAWPRRRRRRNVRFSRAATAAARTRARARRAAPAGSALRLAPRAAPLREAPAESINKTIGYIHMFFKSTNAIIYFVLSTRGTLRRGGKGGRRTGDGRTPTPDDYPRRAGERASVFIKSTRARRLASRRAVPRGL